jgi:hypothetical protein
LGGNSHPKSTGEAGYFFAFQGSGVRYQKHRHLSAQFALANEVAESTPLKAADAPSASSLRRPKEVTRNPVLKIRQMMQTPVRLRLPPPFIKWAFLFGKK